MAMDEWPRTCDAPGGQCPHGVGPDGFETIAFFGLSICHSISKLHSASHVLTGSSCYGTCCSWQKPGEPQSPGRVRRRSEQQHPPTPETQQVRAQGEGETWAAAKQSSTPSMRLCAGQKPALLGPSRGWPLLW